MTAPPPGFDLARLLGGESYRFQFGVRRGQPDWWRGQLDVPDSETLAERTRWLDDPAARADCVTWEGAAAPALAETTEWLGLAPGEITPDAAGAAALGRRWEPDWVLLRRPRKTERMEDGGWQEADISAARARMKASINPEPELPSPRPLPSSILRPPGSPRLVAGCVCFPSHWAVTEKLGLTVPEIHGVVPTLNADLGARIATFLDRLAPGAVFERENWGLAAAPDRNQHPRRGLPRLQADTPPNRVWLRLEHQAFVALPRAEAILFIIGVRVAPLAEALADPALRGAFGRQLAAMPDEIAAYKGLAALRRSPAVRKFFSA